MKGIHVEKEFKGFKDFKVSSDMKRVQQILLNVFSNAVKFTDRGGQIDVVVELEDDGFIRISTIDTGTGIKKKD